MNLEAFQRPVRQLHTSLAEIGENIDYIRKELPPLTIPHGARLRIANTCEKFEGAMNDVRKEIRNLERNLGIDPGEDPLDSGIRTCDPRVTMGFIDRWLRTEIETMHQLVLHLQELSEDSNLVGVANLLVSESATNILNAYSTVQKSLSAIGVQLERDGA